MRYKIVNLTAIISLAGCAGCQTARPTVVGQVMYGPESGMGGVVVTIQQERSPDIKGTVSEEASPEILECAVTDWRGKFSLKGEFWPLIIYFPRDRVYRVHVHRDDHYDLDYEFSYPVQPTSFFMRKKDIGQLVPIPRPKPPSSNPAVPQR